MHVTESTKASLGDYFNCDPVAKDEIDDEILSGNKTYLIWPHKNEYNIGEVILGHNLCGIFIFGKVLVKSH